MRTSSMSLTLLLTCMGLAAAPRASNASPAFYRMVSNVTLAGKSPAWDYLSLDAQRGYLFIGRRQAGVTVFDVASGRVVATIADSEGANKAILVPSLNRGYSVNGDGSTTVFELASLKTIRRIHFGSNADAGSYEPVTGQVLFTMGDSREITFLDARSGAVTARLPLSSSKIEASAPDGKGSVFVAERDRNQVVRIDAHSHRVTAQWPVVGCSEPTGLDYDANDQRIFVGCRGSKPVLAVLDANSGATVARVEIGRGNDGVAFDPRTHTIFASNGVDANLVVVDQRGPDSYALEQAITTRPMARTLALDAAHDRVYLVTAQGAVDPAKKVIRAVAPFYPNVYFDNTFTVLTYKKN